MFKKLIQLPAIAVLLVGVLIAQSTSAATVGSSVITGALVDQPTVQNVYYGYATGGTINTSLLLLQSQPNYDNKFRVDMDGNVYLSGSIYAGDNSDPICNSAGCVASGTGDNLGDHIAKDNLNMSEKNIYNLKEIKFTTDDSDNAKIYTDINNNKTDLIIYLDDNYGLGSSLTDTIVNRIGYSAPLSNGPIVTRDVFSVAYGKAWFNKDVNVGIGTYLPVEKLDINGGIKIGASTSDINVAGVISYSDSDFWGYNGTTWKSFTGGVWTQSTSDSGDIYYSAKANNSVGIGSDFGSGTAGNPRGLLHLYGGGTRNDLILQMPSADTNNTKDQGIAFRNQGGHYTWNIFRQDAGNNLANLVFSTGLDQDINKLKQVFMIDKDGSVGIGSDFGSGTAGNPRGLLHLYGGGTRNDLILQMPSADTNNTKDQGIAFRNQGGHYTWNIYRKPSADPSDDVNNADLVFSSGLDQTITNLSPVMTLTNAGSLILDGGDNVVRINGSGLKTSVLSARDGNGRFNIYTGAESVDANSWKLLNAEGATRMLMTTNGSDPYMTFSTASNGTAGSNFDSWSEQMKINEYGVQINKDLYMTTNKAIRVDGNSDTNLNIGNYGGSGNNKVNVNIAGSLGIGVNDPKSSLHVNSDLLVTGAGARIYLGTSNDPEKDKVWTIDQYHYPNNPSYDKLFRIYPQDNITKPQSGWQSYFTIKPNGYVGIGTIASYKLDVNGTIRGTNVSPSDIRWKDNISTSKYGLKATLNLRGVDFNWKDGVNDEEDGRQIGLIAQEVEKIIPEVVSTDDEGYKSVNYEKIVPVLIEAIKDQQKQIDDLKSRLDSR